MFLLREGLHFAGLARSSGAFSVSSLFRGYYQPPANRPLGCGIMLMMALRWKGVRVGRYLIDPASFTTIYPAIWRW